jgi:CRISPR system Cascade subunit CasE
MHRTLKNVFELAPTDAERILFRVDWDEQQRAFRTLILSRTLPDFSVLPTGYALNIEGPKAYNPPFAASQYLAFRLLANPTIKKTIERDGKPHKLRWGLFREEDQLEWLTRKLQEAGAELIECFVIPRGAQRNCKRQAGGESQQTHFAVLFEGFLKVNEPTKLRAALENGIGSAKGFGFGLLSLARA